MQNVELQSQALFLCATSLSLDMLCDGLSYHKHALWTLLGGNITRKGPSNYRNLTTRDWKGMWCWTFFERGAVLGTKCLPDPPERGLGCPRARFWFHFIWFFKDVRTIFIVFDSVVHSCFLNSTPVHKRDSGSINSQDFESWLLEPTLESRQIDICGTDFIDFWILDSIWFSVRIPGSWILFDS